jgi:hypothetical protein
MPVPQNKEKKDKKKELHAEFHLSIYKAKK